MYKTYVNDQYEFDVEVGHEGFQVNETNRNPDIIRISDHNFHVIYNGKSHRVTFIERNSKEFKFKINGNPYTVNVDDPYDLLLQQLGMDMGASGLLEDLQAPMPGLVIEIKVNEGDQVAKDQPIVVLEAMKMENVLKAPADATISKIHVEKQDKVEKNQLIINFE